MIALRSIKEVSSGIIDRWLCYMRINTRNLTFLTTFCSPYVFAWHVLEGGICPSIASEFVIPVVHGMANLLNRYIALSMLNLPSNCHFNLSTHKLGTYNPIPSRVDNMKEVRLNHSRIKYWLSVGAKVSTSHPTFTMNFVRGS